MPELASAVLASARDLPLAAVALLMVVAVSTPGPANFFLLASGARVGFRRTFPTGIGIACGFFVLVLLQGVALGQALRAAPWAATALQVLFSAFLLWLAWKVANSGPVGAEDDEAGGRVALLPIPLGFVRAWAFPFLNPKAWAIAASVLSLHGSGDPARALPEALVVGAIGLATAAAAHSAWAGIGASLRAFLADARRARAFNLAMGASLVAVVAWGWL